MARNSVYAPVSGFHVGECTNVEQTHFWSQGPLVNGVRSWQLIIKHDLTHQFHGWKPGVRPIVPLLEPRSTCEWYQKLAIDYKTWPDTWCPHQCPGFKSVRAPMWNRLTSGARVYLWCQKLAIDHKT